MHRIASFKNSCTAALSRSGHPSKRSRRDSIAEAEPSPVSSPVPLKEHRYCWASYETASVLRSDCPIGRSFIFSCGRYSECQQHELHRSSGPLVPANAVAKNPKTQLHSNKILGLPGLNLWADWLAATHMAPWSSSLLRRSFQLRLRKPTRSEQNFSSLARPSPISPTLLMPSARASDAEQGRRRRQP